MTQGRSAGPALSWQLGAIEGVAVETHRVKTFTVRLPEWRPFRPGQHFDVRLTAPDGYQAQRSYSVASAPERAGVIDLTIELMEEGEVSPYFHDVTEVGDPIELRGPIGGPFTWMAAAGGPLLLVGGGSGVVPLMSMLRHRALAAPEVRALLLYSSRSADDVIYRAELDLAANEQPSLTVLHTLTRAQPEGWSGYRRRVDEAMIGEALARLPSAPLVFICGPTAFVEAAADAVVAAGVAPDRVRTERFGPSGT